MNAAIASECHGLRLPNGAVGISLPLDELAEPGTYICNWSGHLLRISEADRDAERFAAAGRAHSPSWTVTRISEDPHIPRYQAKILADGLGLCTSF